MELGRRRSASSANDDCRSRPAASTRVRMTPASVSLAVLNRDERIEGDGDKVRGRRPAVVKDVVVGSTRVLWHTTKAVDPRA